MVRGDTADDGGDRDRLPVPWRHAGQAHDEEDRREQLRRDHQGQEVVDGVELPLRECVRNHDALRSR